ncbi:MAG: sugar isomerase domain-containing protein [Chitinophagaceae bacterium]
MEPTEQYLHHTGQIIECIRKQKSAILQTAAWFSSSILAGRMVHVFGSGHSRIMTEEMWPRYGSFPGFNPIVELSLTYHNNVVGANGQRQAMFLENVSGLASRIIRNFKLSEMDSALVISSSGANIVPVEMAEIFQSNGIKVVALITKNHSSTSQSKRVDGKKLSDFADLILDTGAPEGDAMVNIDGLDTPVAPGSTIGGVILVNCIKAEVARILTQAGHPPKVLTAASKIGAERSTALFEAAYDEHAWRLSKLFAFEQ